MGVSISGGTPKWLVYFMGNPIKMDDEQGYPYFRKPPNTSLDICYKVACFDPGVRSDTAVPHLAKKDFPCMCGCQSWKRYTIGVETVP